MELGRDPPRHACAVVGRVSEAFYGFVLSLEGLLDLSRTAVAAEMVVGIYRIIGEGAL